MLCVVARYGDQTLRFSLPEQTASVGSASNNDFVVPFPGVSRQHAAIERISDGIRVVDLGSKNGLSVAGKRVAEALLTGDAAIRIGRATLTIEESRTSDVELALKVGHGPSQSRETAESRGSDRNDAAAALRVIREIEAGGSKFSGRRRQQTLAACREALGAQAVVLFDAADDGPRLLGVAGQLPETGLLERIARYAPRRRKTVVPFEISATDIHAVGCAHASHLLVAIASEPQPAWTRDFILFVGEKLLHPTKEEKEPESASGDNFNVPDGMILGESEAMQRLLLQISRTVSSSMNVLLLGETGTGKELFARLIHASGPARNGPFVAVNCAAIPGELLESELFGVQKRVATGVDPRPGLFVEANGGTILLDEISEMPDRMQAKLLRVLQEHEILPVGASTPKKIDVCVIATSNRELLERVQTGQFRADLYYRLRGLQFHIPPLRERPEDIPALVLGFIERAAHEYEKSVRGVTRKALQLLLDHDWPGNVRELESEIRRAVLVCSNGAAINAEHLGSVRGFVARKPTHVSEGPETSTTLQAKIDSVERQEIEAALCATDGNQSAAARLLGITRNGLAMKIKRLRK